MRVHFVAWSDVHWHNYPSGITIADIDDVEQQIENYAAEHQVDFYLFGGDRFQMRNPADRVKVQSDYAMSRRARRLGIPGVIVRGNHDCDDVSVASGNTYRVVKAFPELFPGLYVAEDVGTVTIQTAAGAVVNIHALPADNNFDITKYKIDPSAINILVFHGLLQGASLDQSGRIKAKEGYSLSDIDRSEFDLVLGGDVHIPQSFALRRTWGGYIGSTLQLNVGDAGSQRGFLDVTIEKGKIPQILFVASKAPQFHRVEIPAANVDAMFDGWKAAVQAGTATFDNYILNVTITGPALLVDQIESRDVEARFMQLGKLRSVKVRKRADVMIEQAIPELGHGVETPLADPEIYVKSGKVDLQGLDRERLMSVGVELIREAIGANG